MATSSKKISPTQPTPKSLPRTSPTSKPAPISTAPSSPSSVPNRSTATEQTTLRVPHPLRFPALFSIPKLFRDERVGSDDQPPPNLHSFCYGTRGRSFSSDINSQQDSGFSPRVNAVLPQAVIPTGVPRGSRYGVEGSWQPL